MCECVCVSVCVVTENSTNSLEEGRAYKLCQELIQFSTI